MVKVFAAKSDGLSLVPGTHRVERENQIMKMVSDLHIHMDIEKHSRVCVCAHPFRVTDVYTYYIP